MEFQLIKPSVLLAPFIKNYWIIDKNQYPLNPHKQRIFSHGCVELNFYFRDQFLSYNANDKEGQLQPGAVISGQKKNYQDFLPLGKVGIISVVFKPQAARLFFNLPVNKIINQNVPLADVSGNLSGDLEDKILNTDDNNQRIKLIEEFLLQKLSENYLYNFKRISESLKLINHSPRHSINTISGRGNYFSPGVLFLFK